MICFFLLIYENIQIQFINLFERCCHASSVLMARWPTTLLSRSRRRPPPPKKEKKIASHTHRYAHEISWQIHSICTYDQPPPPSSSSSKKKNKKKKKRSWLRVAAVRINGVHFLLLSISRARQVFVTMTSKSFLTLLYFTFFLSYLLQIK